MTSKKIYLIAIIILACCSTRCSKPNGRKIDLNSVEFHFVDLSPESENQVFMLKTIKVPVHLEKEILLDRRDIDSVFIKTGPQDKVECTLKQSGVPKKVAMSRYDQNQMQVLGMDIAPCYSEIPPQMVEKNNFELRFQFTKTGREKLLQLTTDHVGRIVGIVVDGNLIHIGQIEGPVSGGIGMARFTLPEEDAKKFYDSISK